MADILKGTFVMDVLGGNHTHQAFTEIGMQDKVPVTIYVGLTNELALFLGYEHNRVHLNSHQLTF